MLLIEAPDYNLLFRWFLDLNLREHGRASDAHFTVDGTLIDMWASLKSFPLPTA